MTGTTATMKCMFQLDELAYTSVQDCSLLAMLDGCY